MSERLEVGGTDHDHTGRLHWRCQIFVPSGALKHGSIRAKPPETSLHVEAGAAGSGFKSFSFDHATDGFIPGLAEEHHAAAVGIIGRVWHRERQIKAGNDGAACVNSRKNAVPDAWMLNQAQPLP
jgi:hypothetical protein